MAEKTSYAMDIRPLFTGRDVHAMSKASHGTPFRLPPLSSW